MPRSLQRQLLAWVLVPLAALAIVNATTAWFSAGAAADLVTDRMLLASARSIAEQVRMEDGFLQVTVPPAALEMFDTGVGDFVYYAVTDDAGRLLAGATGLADLLPAAAADERARVAVFRGHRLRLVKVAHAISGLGGGAAAQVTVGIGLNSRDALALQLWWLGLGQQLALVAAAGGFMVLGLKRGLAPLIALRDAVQRRSTTSLEPLDDGLVQAELKPLVQALNHQLSRVQRQLAAQQRFVANAAHQLRTPLTLLNVQATYALRRPEDNAEVLEAIRASTGRLSRLAAQLLTLSRAEPGSRRPRHDPIDLAALAARILDGLTESALAKGIDLGLDVRAKPAISGDNTLLGEMLVNLVDNAIRYCPAGSAVTLVVDAREGAAVLTVTDNGPGVREEDLDRIFERFYRVPGMAGDGSGLGLAIVREVAEAAGGSVVARASPAGGLTVEVLLPVDRPEAPVLEPVR